ncbi:ATP-binding protein [Paenibacillus sp. HB172176]|uniref:sensor histidine kinase n=1 Tax=Paenibacillus sp. HB172176 TaxID=2493690 RepID=UPI00143974BB|nr:ATP-binding protein [Paenibacillus sp. HB172176]
MFRRTRLRLVLLNAVVFFVLFNAFGVTIYLYTQHRLYEDADRKLDTDMQNLLYRGNHEWMEHRERNGSDLILWDRGGKASAQLPDVLFDSDELEKLSAVVDKPGCVTVELNGSTYRSSSKSVGNGVVQLLYNLDAERSVLRNLLIILLLCLAGSLILAVLAGFLLAGRALVPIQRAWDKQQQFVSDASHELRTPLAVMRIHLERFLRNPDRTIEKESKKVAVMLDETERMSRLVANLLTLARSDTHELQLMKEDVNLTECIGRITESAEGLAAAKGLRVEVSAEEELKLQADRERINQLLLILLDNAIRYTSEGEISLSAERRGQSIRLSVSDTGIGMNGEEMPRIFDRFYRADKMRSRSDGGVGLGLSIAKWIVEAHGGAISVESEPGKGSTFHVMLPVSS